MEIYKFGGASVKSAEAVRSVAKIIQQTTVPLVIVISAMGKMTNLFEKLLFSYFSKDNSANGIFNQVKKYHIQITDELFDNTPDSIKGIFKNIEIHLKKKPSENYDYEYDQLVCFGELLSTKIVSEYLTKKGIFNKWIDIRKYLRTDKSFRNANVNDELSSKLINNVFHFKDTKIYVTQGFIGGTTSGRATTLGREGSDYTATLLGNYLASESVTIWKDVPGVMNADPKLFKETNSIKALSYREAAEISHSGAKIIHPKTIKPAENKKIPVFVKSFENPKFPGTVIHDLEQKLDLDPIYTIRQDQVLITLTPKDFSFIGISDLNKLFNYFFSLHIEINLFQQSAIDLNMIIDHPGKNLEKMLGELSKSYDIKFNTELELVTIRYYSDDSLKKIINEKHVFIEQKSRKTARLVVK